MRQSLISSTAKTLTVVTTLFSLVIFAASAIAEQKPAKPRKKAIGNVEYGDAAVTGRQAGKSKFPTRHQANVKFGDITREVDKKKKRKNKDIVIIKQIDKASPLLSRTATPTGDNKALTGGRLLEGQGALGTASPSATGAPAIPASPRGGGAVIR